MSPVEVHSTMCRHPRHCLTARPARRTSGRCPLHLRSVLTAHTRRARVQQAQQPADAGLRRGTPSAQVQNDMTLTGTTTWTSEASSKAWTPSTHAADTPGPHRGAVLPGPDRHRPDFAERPGRADVDQTTFTSFGDTYPEGPICWRVQAVDGSGNPLPGATPRSFLKKSPVPPLQLPAEGPPCPVTTRCPGPRSPSPRPTTSRSTRTATPRATPQPRRSREHQRGSTYVLDDLAPTQGPYAWRVRRATARTGTGDWSASGTFTVTSPGVTCCRPWTAQPSSRRPAVPVGAGPERESYRFERRPGTTGGATETVTHPAPAWAPTAAIAGGSWQWRVTAYDTAGHLLGGLVVAAPLHGDRHPGGDGPRSISGIGPSTRR